MHWFHPLTPLELAFAAALIVGLGTYVTRHWQVGRALRQSSRGLLWKLPLRLLILGLLLAGLLGPALGTTRKQIRATGKDVWVLIDVSRSMAAADVRPTRLERALAALPGLVNTVGADRAALVAFAGSAQIVCPLTYDQGALLLYARALHSEAVPVPGSDIGAALDTVARKIQAEPASPALAARSPVVVLLTDGEDFGERPAEREAAQGLAREHVPVFVLAVGTTAGAPVPGAHLPRQDTENETTSASRQPISRLRPEGLRALAATTGGRYFELTDQVDESRELATAVAGLRGQVREVRLLEVAANKYQYALVLALALLMVDVLVTVRVFRLDA